MPRKETWAGGQRADPVQDLPLTSPRPWPTHDTSVSSSLKLCPRCQLLAERYDSGAQPRWFCPLSLSAVKTKSCPQAFPSRESSGSPAAGGFKDSCVCTRTFCLGMIYQVIPEGARAGLRFMRAGSFPSPAFSPYVKMFFLGLEHQVLQEVAVAMQTSERIHPCVLPSSPRNVLIRVNWAAVTRQGPEGMRSGVR